MISIRNLYKTFNNKSVINNINLEINKGDRIVIIGPSGSGKSTMLRCINLLEEPTKGEIWLENRRVSNIDISLYEEFKNLKKGKQLNKKISEFDKKYKWNLDIARTKMGMVFQHFNLFNNLNVLSNLTIAPIKLNRYSRQEAELYASELLEHIGLIDKKYDYPSKLSGGQKQRVAIARALMNKPDILLFDEPTSALDPEMVGEVLDLIKKLADNGMTMICVTHEMHFAKNIATNVVFMEDGKIIENNNSKDFFENPKSNRLKNFINRINH